MDTDPASSSPWLNCANYRPIATDVTATPTYFFVRRVGVPSTQLYVLHDAGADPRLFKWSGILKVEKPSLKIRFGKHLFHVFQFRQTGTAAQGGQGANAPPKNIKGGPRPPQNLANSQSRGPYITRPRAYQRPLTFKFRSAYHQVILIIWRKASDRHYKSYMCGHEERPKDATRLRHTPYG